MKRLTFNTYFKVAAKVTVYINILIGSDLELFIDPYSIANGQHERIAQRIYLRMKSFFETLNKTYIIPNDKRNGVIFLAPLTEANEYGFGYSDANKGKGIGPTKAEVIFKALSNNKFAKAGVSITNEALNVLLLVKGIGQDNMSDTIASVCRDIFAEFTLQQCKLHGIATSPTKIEYYDPTTKKWLTKTIELPHYMIDKHIILVPKNLVRNTRDYTGYYNWFVASNHISKDILNGTITPTNPQKYINTLKNGDRKAIIKNINEHFKKPKEKLIDFVTEYNGSLENFQEHIKNNFPDLSDDDIDKIING
jgi:hypothetical protein